MTSLVAIATESSTSAINQNETMKVIEKEPNWQLSIIAGGFSTHLTTKYEPDNGYTEQHSSLGVEIGQTGPGWVASIQATRFNDSHGENSFMGIGSQYSAVYWGQPTSAGKRVSMEIKKAIEQNRLEYIMT